MAGPIDFDQQATTPLAPEALAAMLPLLEQQHWNPNSPHRGARIARAALEAGREQVATLLGTAAETIIFTSGATEANNLALKSFIAPRGTRRRRIVSFATEHASVVEPLRHMERLGVPVTVLGVRADGLPDLAVLRDAVGPDVALVSAMRVNNEIGSIWPTAAIATIAHDAGARFHCDAAQALGKIDCRLDAGLGAADLVSLSGHKMHGPKGIGALYVRPGIALAPQIEGGGQERGLRSGTQSPALAAGFGAAADLGRQRMAADAAHAAVIQAMIVRGLAGVRFRINGPEPGPDRIATNLSLTFEGVDSGRLIAALPGIALSAGSACGSGSGRPSHVLKAIGLDDHAARSTIRLGWGRYSAGEEVGEAIMVLAQTVARMQGMAA
jgi:cysteine desulfurase